MSNNTDSVRAENESRKSKATYFLSFPFYFFLFILIFSTGCSFPEQRAVELYVDAVELKELDENEKAVEKLDSAVRLNERFSLAYSLLGEIYQQMQDYEKSAVAYEKATQLNPWSFRDFFSLGRVYQVVKKFAQAVKAYARACELAPNHLDAHINAAKCYYEIGDYNESLIYGKRAEQIAPDADEVRGVLSDIYASQGDIYESKKDYEQAIASYKRAMEIDSNDPKIMISLAVCYLRTGRESVAKELLISATQIEPDNNVAYQYLGYCYLRLDDVDRATASYSRAIEINDKDWQAHRGLGVAYMLRAINDEDDALKEKAIRQWRLSLDISPDQPRRERLLKLIERYSK
jgi:tetratricopeptide (TPR) repeat protein